MPTDYHTQRNGTPNPVTLAPRSHGHAVLVRTPAASRPGFPIEWHVTTVCGQEFTTHHVDLGSVTSVECAECARHLATPPTDRPATLTLVRFAPPQREAA